MNANSSATAWVIFLVAHDNTDGGGADAEVEPYVGYEAIEDESDPHKFRQNCELTALLRGGYVVGIVRDSDEASVQAAVTAAEKSLLRMR
jgi:hypothetical protein